MGRVERMRGQDAAYLSLEGPATPYHIAALAIVEGPVPSLAAIIDAIGGRLRFAPRLRRRLAFLPMALPRWVDDEHFDLAYHVRRTDLDRSGGERQLFDVAERILEQHLDRSRPLWECWVIGGLAHDRFALLTKMHHSMLDGVSGAELMRVIFDVDAEPAAHTPDAWVAESPPSRARMTLDALGGMAFAPLRLAGRADRLVRSPLATARRVRDVAAGFATLVAAGVAPAPRSPLNFPIGPNRSMAVTTVPLEDLREIKRTLGGTVNDVVLAAVSGGIRTLLQARGADVRTGVLRALVPVSLRTDGDGTAGNNVSGIIAPLPVCEADPGRRLAIIRRATRQAKESPQAAGAELLLEVGASLPQPIARLIASAQNVQRFFNVSVTNIPGPQQRLWILGRPVEEIVPLPPLSGNAGLIVAAMSYAGQMTFGVVADRDGVPDAALVAEGIEKSIVGLLHEAWGEL